MGNILCIIEESQIVVTIFSHGTWKGLHQKPFIIVCWYIFPKDWINLCCLIVIVNISFEYFQPHQALFKKITYHAWYWVTCHHMAWHYCRITQWSLSVVQQTHFSAHCGRPPIKELQRPGWLHKTRQQCMLLTSNLNFSRMHTHGVVLAVHFIGKCRLLRNPWL